MDTSIESPRRGFAIAVVYFGVLLVPFLLAALIIPSLVNEVTKLADLESREVLLAKLAGAFKASLFGAAYLFNAPLSQAVRTVDALREKQESAA